MLKKSPRGVQLIVAADFTRRARFLIRIANRAQQTALASFARVADIRSAKPGKPNRAIRLQDRLDEQALNIEEPHVFITIARENGRMSFRA